MAKQKNLLQKNISNLRKMLRQRMELLARSHRGCSQARGCGCYVDQTLNLLDEAERDLFEIELASYAADGLKDGGGYDRYATTTTSEETVSSGNNSGIRA